MPGEKATNVGPAEIRESAQQKSAPEPGLKWGRSEGITFMARTSGEKEAER